MWLFVESRSGLKIDALRIRPVVYASCMAWPSPAKPSRGARSLLSFFWVHLCLFFLGSLVSFILVSLLSFSSFGSNILEREVPW